MDNRITDSAASGTALATGYKTNNTYLGVIADGTPVESLMDVAKRENKKTGIIATTYLQHATPAAFYAHIPSRHEYLAITEQLINSSIDVAIGGGMAFFEERYKENVEETLKNNGFTLAKSLDEVASIEPNKRVLALLADKEIENRSGYLANATREALRLLDNEEGFALMVEGSLIDGMGHANDAKAQQGEMRDFMEAIEVAVDFAKHHPDTLVVVTGDHETGGLSIVSCDADFCLSEQGVEYRWTTKGHSGTMLPIYLYGTAAENINGIMENAELGAKLKELISK
jgi:alkaline phosphatase